MLKRVLLADDHQVVRDGLQVLLQKQPDITVVGMASTGLEALHLARHLHPTVAIMDIAMPAMNGIEATRQIKAEIPDTRVIILSMHAMADYVRDALRAGARGYLLKECAGAEVVHAVQAVCDGRRYVSQQISEVLMEDTVFRTQQDAKVPLLDRLSPRERSVLALVVEGKPSVEIARCLDLSPKTVETYRSRLMSKLGVRNVVELVRFAIRHHVLPPE